MQGTPRKIVSERLMLAMAFLLIAPTYGMKRCGGPRPGPSGVGNKDIGSVNWHKRDQYVGDFDGDGLDDLFQVSNGGLHYCDGDGLTTRDTCRKVSDNDWTDRNIEVGDFDGDGRDDLFTTSDKNSRFCTGRLLRSIVSCTKVHDKDWTNRRLTPGDFNGDGVDDLVLFGTSNTKFCAGPGIASRDNCSNFNNRNWREKFGSRAADFNGDGISDLFLFTKTGKDAKVCYGPALINDVCTTLADTDRWDDSRYKYRLADFSGDGKDDLLLLSAGNYDSLVCTGPGLTSCGRVNNSKNWMDRFEVTVAGYFVSAAKAAVVRRDDNALKICFNLSGGGSCSALQTVGRVKDAKLIAGNFNGGRDDLLFAEEPKDDWQCDSTHDVTVPLAGKTFTVEGDFVSGGGTDRECVYEGRIDRITFNWPSHTIEIKNRANISSNGEVDCGVRESQRGKSISGVHVDSLTKKGIKLTHRFPYEARWIGIQDGPLNSKQCVWRGSHGTHTRTVGPATDRDTFDSDDNDPIKRDLSAYEGPLR